MIPRLHHRFAALCVAAGLAISTVSCQKVPLLAPSGSSISLTTAVTVVPLGGTVEIIAQVIEPSGTPPQRGTLVSFTTSLGTLQPTEAETDTAGRAIVRFIAGNGSGTAVITALSGGVSVGGNTLRLLVGTAAVGSVRLTANPTLLQANGGTSTITAQSLDVNGNPLVSAPVNFSTTAGTIDQSFATSDQNGLATTILRTSTTATVTATVGVQGGGSTAPTTTTTAPPTTTPPPTQTPTPTPPASSGQQQGSVIVNVSSAPGLVITPPTTPPGEGLPAAFTIAVTAATANGSAVRDVTVDWGDGSTQSLGVVTGGSDCSLVHQVSELGAGESRSAARDPLKIETFFEFQIACVNFQNRFTTSNVREVDGDLTIESSRSRKSFVENVRPVGGSNDDHRSRLIKTIHLDQQLVECLILIR